MRVWIRYFLGTPRRFTTTMVTALILTVIIFPGLLAWAIARLACAIQPLLGQAMVVVIVIVALRAITGGRR